MGKLLRFPTPVYRFAGRLDRIRALLDEMPEHARPTAYKLVESAVGDLRSYIQEREKS